MKKVFEHIDFATVGMMRAALEAAGIATELRNASGSSLMGSVPFTQVYPELWVLDVADEARALAVVEEHRSAKAVLETEAWTCTSCGESNPGNFAECWSCGAPVQV
jgi:rubrerythrin